MGSHTRHNRLKHSAKLLVLLVGFSVTNPTVMKAATQDVSLTVRPHCEQIESEKEDTMLGPIPDLEEMVTLGDGKICTSFQVEDPQTLKTKVMAVGDTLDFDIVVQNPSKQAVQHVRAWLAYDTNVFEGVSIEVSEHFPLITPGESDFDEENGYVMVEAANEENGANTKSTIAVARVQLRAKIAPAAGTFISFYDIQRNGHTTVTTTENDTDEELLSDEPGGLHVLFGEGEGADVQPAASGAVANEGDSLSPDDLPPPPIPLEDVGNDQPEVDPTVANNLLGGTAAPSASASEENAPSPVENGNACLQNSDCRSNNCLNGICGAEGETVQQQAPAQGADRTAFALLQVRNVRVTTDGSSIFLAWDALNSSSLSAYNIYYGTTSGRYIQRKTISGNMQSVVLRNLPLGATYYLAIRAVNTDEEESAFSPEVSVEVGNPATSTAPLVQGVGGVNPIGDLTGNGAVSVPGSTGVPSALAMLVVLCAAIGTFLASKRQLAVCTEQPSA
ncbi:hypothetical protein COU76_00720 [Candidatus Peregrinibacteria bacterium CG10_big_fil_rev_8_21_14_0_10_49_10]|nr:MAG: hypothetical protein COU76_00720 [Candidatus Peregrinibacteria bacterium CG10_big_fil_rev_8_21_14_0_10_49_10]